MLDRRTMTASEWQRILRKELSEKRPVFYTGESYSYGHAFACDTMQRECTTSIGGEYVKSNGYFRLTNLRPVGCPDHGFSRNHRN